MYNLLKFTISLLSIFVFTACSDVAVSETIKNNNPTAETNKPTTTTTSSQDVLPKKEACDFLDEQFIKDLFGWQEVDIVKNTTMSLERYKVFTQCNVTVSNETGFELRLEWQNEKGQKNKILEKRFDIFLEKGQKLIGEKRAKYVKIPSSGDNQTIYGVGEGNFGYVYYTLRERIGNQVEIQLTFNMIGGDRDKILEKLQGLVAEIGK